MARGERDKSRNHTPARMLLHQIYHQDLARAALQIANVKYGRGMKRSLGVYAVPDVTNSPMEPNR